MELCDRGMAHEALQGWHLEVSEEMWNHYARKPMQSTAQDEVGGCMEERIKHTDSNVLKYLCVISLCYPESELND